MIIEKQVGRLTTDRLLLVVLFVFLGLVFSANNAKAFEFSLTEAEFNQKLAEKLPMIKAYSMLSIKTNVLNSKFLQDGRVALYIEGEVKSPFMKKSPVFNSHVEGIVSFDDKLNRIFLKEATILDSNISIEQTQVSSNVKKMVEKGVLFFLKNKSIYQIKDRSLKEQLAGNYLKEIYIKNKEMYFRF